MKPIQLIVLLCTFGATLTPIITNAKNTVHITMTDGHIFSGELISKSLLVKDKTGHTQTITYLPVSIEHKKMNRIWGG